MTVTAEEYAAALAEHGLTPLDIADAYHRDQLADPNFDPIAQAMDLIGEASAKLLMAVAYLGGYERQRLVDALAESGDTELKGHARTLDVLDTLKVWVEDAYERATAAKADV